MNASFASSLTTPHQESWPPRFMNEEYVSQPHWDGIFITKMLKSLSLRRDWSQPKTYLLFCVTWRWSSRKRRPLCSVDCVPATITISLLQPAPSLKCPLLSSPDLTSFLWAKLEAANLILGKYGSSTASAQRFP